MELVSKHIESAEMRTYLEKQIPRLSPKLKAKLQAELIVRSRRPLAEKYRIYSISRKHIRSCFLSRKNYRRPTMRCMHCRLIQCL